MGCKDCDRIKRDKKENRRKIEYYYYFISICLMTGCGFIIFYSRNDVVGGFLSGFMIGICLMTLAIIFDKFIDSGMTLSI